MLLLVVVYCCRLYCSWCCVLCRRCCQSRCSHCHSSVLWSTAWPPIISDSRYAWSFSLSLSLAGVHVKHAHAGDVATSCIPRVCVFYVYTILFWRRPSPLCHRQNCKNAVSSKLSRQPLPRNCVGYCILLWLKLRPITRLRRRPDWQKSRNTAFTIADISTKVNDNDNDRMWM